MSLTICVVHDDTQLACFRLIDLFEPNNVRMIEYLQDFSFTEGRLLVILTHFLDINLFDNCIALFSKHPVINLLKNTYII